MALNFIDLLLQPNRETITYKKRKRTIQGDKTEFIWIFNNNETQDCNSVNFLETTRRRKNGALSINEYDWIAAEIYIEIFNASGSNDNFDCSVTNSTKSTTLLSATGIINNNEKGTNKVIVDKSDIDEDDNILFKIDDGVIGTADGNKFNGYVIFRITNYYDLEDDLVRASGGTLNWDTPR